MTNIEWNLEDSTSILEQAENLMILIVEYLDDNVPNPDDKEYACMARVFCDRIDLLRSLVYAAEDALAKGNKILKQNILKSEVA